MGEYESYFSSISSELVSRADRVRHLIGSRHWLTDGHHKEVIVREALKRYLPSQLTLGTGFIKGIDTGNCSTEVDILISDFSKHPPLFNEGGVQIIVPVSAVAYFEMKSKYSSTVFKEAMDSIYGIQVPLKNYELWRCICFGTIDMTFESFVKSSENAVSDWLSINKIGDAKKAIGILPKCVASFDKFVIFIRADIEKNRIVMNFFNLGATASAAFFIDLFEHIRIHCAGFLNSNLSDVLQPNTDDEYKRVYLELNNAD